MNHAKWVVMPGALPRSRSGTYLHAMNIRTGLLRFCLCLGLAAANALPQAAAAPSLDEISSYLESLKYLRSGLVQVNPDGTRREGTLYVHRPGRMRLEYSRPKADVVIAGGGRISLIEAGSKVLRQYPLRSSPLALFLAAELDLETELGASSLIRGDERTMIIAADPERPGLGTLELQFINEPLRLHGWTVTDAYGRRTRVVLVNLEVGVRPEARLFNVQFELGSRSGN